MSSPQETRLERELRQLVSAQPFSPDIDAIGQRARKKRHQRAMAVRGATSAGVAVVVAGGVFTAVHGAGGPATATAAPTATTSTGAQEAGATQLMSLAASVTSASSSQSGDASFVVMSLSLGGSALPTTYNIYADNGALYMAPSESGLSAEVSGGGVITDPTEASEVAAAESAATGDITAAREKMAAILSPFEEKGVWQEERQKSWIKLAQNAAEQQQLLKANPGVSADASAGKNTQDVTGSAIWNASVDALTAGAGNSQVRAGVLRLLATVPGITVTKSTTGGEATLTLSASSAVLDGGTPEVLTIDAATGSPVEFTAAAGEGMQAAKATYKVSRVTLADVAKGGF